MSSVGCSLRFLSRIVETCRAAEGGAARYRFSLVGRHGIRSGADNPVTQLRRSLMAGKRSPCTSHAGPSKTKFAGFGARRRWRVAVAAVAFPGHGRGDGVSSARRYGYQEDGQDCGKQHCGQGVADDSRSPGRDAECLAASARVDHPVSRQAAGRHRP